MIKSLPLIPLTIKRSLLKNYRSSISWSGLPVAGRPRSKYNDKIVAVNTSYY